MAGKIVKGLGGNSSSQSVRDRLNAAKHSISGSGLAKSICKATTDQVISPKAKHLNYLTLCTNEPNVSIPELADKLLERTQDASWVVVFKALITIHNLMNQGNERFTQYVASNNRTVSLQNFSDKSGVQGYDMSLFIRRYARYINQKAVSYRSMAFDFCRVKRGKADGVLRTMATEKLLKALPVIQEQVDALVEFDATPNELCNNVINAAFILLFNDLIRLFACYNDGIINLLEQYFEMNKKQCREALDIYKKFVLRMEKVSAFLRVAERFGIDKGDIPDLAKAPSSLLEALEQHLASLEGRKLPTTSSTTSSSTGTNRPANEKSGNSTTVNGSSSVQFTQAERQKIIEEEKMRLAAFKEQRQLSLERMAAVSSTLSNVPEEAPAYPATNAASTATNAGSTTVASNRPSDDLLGMFEGPTSATAQQSSALPAESNAAWQPAAANPFSGRVVNFEAAFGTTTQTSSGIQDQCDGIFFETNFGNILQPQSATSQQPNPVVGQPNDKPAGPQPTSTITTDIDSSIASLAGSLNISDAGHMKKQDHRWMNPNATMQQRTGGTAYTGPTIASGPTVSWSVPAPAAPPAGMVASPFVAYHGQFGMQPPMATAWQPQGMPYGAPSQQMPVPPGAVPYGQPAYPVNQVSGNFQTQPQAAAFPAQSRPFVPVGDPFDL